LAEFFRAAVLAFQNRTFLLLWYVGFLFRLDHNFCSRLTREAYRDEAEFESIRSIWLEIRSLLILSRNFPSDFFFDNDLLRFGGFFSVCLCSFAWHIFEHFFKQRNRIFLVYRGSEDKTIKLGAV